MEPIFVLPPDLFCFPDDSAFFAFVGADRSLANDERRGG
jgi:hypothetical protein